MLGSKHCFKKETTLAGHVLRLTRPQVLSAEAPSASCHSPRLQHLHRVQGRNGRGLPLQELKKDAGLMDSVHGNVEITKQVNGVCDETQASSGF